MSELVLETNPIELEKATSTEVTSSSTTIEPVKQGSIVEGLKKEYSVVGDGLYASVSAEEAPQWLIGILDNVISSRLDANLVSLRQANMNIINALSELEIAKNQYQELININATIDSVVASRLTTLNATVDQNTASIIRLDANKVTETEAISIAGNVVQASLDSGAINARVGNVETALTNTNVALASTTAALEAQFDDIAAVTNARVGNVETALTNTNVALASTTTALEAKFDDIAAVTSMLENDIIATADKVGANFAYNATLKLDYNGTDYYYVSGFGLKTTLAGSTNPNTPIAGSEFWINADKLKFTNSNGTGSTSPFSIDASGTTPQVTFNGKVKFSNITEAPQLGSTPQEVVDSINSGNTTTIDGSKITTGSLSALSANLGIVTAGKLENEDKTFIVDLTNKYIYIA